jgi:hypothetical protein
MALDYREVTIQGAAKILGCSKAVVKTLVARGEIGVMRYLPHRADGRVRKMLSQEDVEIVARRRSLDAFGLEHRGVVVFGPDAELRHAAASALRIAGFRVESCMNVLEALSCSPNGERPAMIECGYATHLDCMILASVASSVDVYGFYKSEALRPLVRWAWGRVKARHDALKA